MSSSAELGALISPDRTGVVVGYRAWRLVSDPKVSAAGSLRAAFKTSHVTGNCHAWRLDAPTEARCQPTCVVEDCSHEGCRSGCDDPPQWGCSCGLYAYFLDPLYWGRREFTPSFRLVCGAVMAWGRIIHHQRNSFFRAEKMLPVAFMEIPPFPNHMQDQCIQACEKLLLVSEALAAPILPDPQALREYAHAEAEKWQ